MTTEIKSVDDILDFAVKEEEAAESFYRDLAGKVDKAWMKEVFEGFAREEVGHKAKLLAVKEGKKLLASEAKIADLKIGDYLVEADISDTGALNYQQALVIAMKKEKAAFRLYSDLADKTDDVGVKDILLGLAQEEAKHKLRFEVEYDEFVLTEN